MVGVYEVDLEFGWASWGIERGLYWPLAWL